MKILCLDTSSKFLSLAVAEDKKILARMHRCLDRKHSTRLVSYIDKILNRAKVPLKKLDGFCVSKGPGSFTGLRIGITTIKGLAFTLGKPVVAIPSLDILAQNTKKIKAKKNKGELSWVCPIVDAKQNKVYTCLYQRQNGKLKRKSAYSLLSLEDLLKQLKGEIIFLGDATPLYREKIRNTKKIKAIFAEEKFWYPRAAQAITLALERFGKGRVEDVNRLAPLYLYPKECQIKKVKR
ncbi:MAG: tRNA (adenosine(37)-N6)-threonylcarbamoyltransferase complex dimerization subunit type 1 TsaB [Omnitrophica bacterium]|nr:tRNA (adenosine(37)-N6)-threonylcarbamoyltransferase complex dimerization subunit type 1 TsaB [Candidatus Omnitrophota bacterium]